MSSLVRATCLCVVRPGGRGRRGQQLRSRFCWVQGGAFGVAGGRARMRRASPVVAAVGRGARVRRGQRGEDSMEHWLDPADRRRARGGGGGQTARAGGIGCGRCLRAAGRGRSSHRYVLSTPRAGEQQCGRARGRCDERPLRLGPLRSLLACWPVVASRVRAGLHVELQSPLSQPAARRSGGVLCRQSTARSLPYMQRDG